MISFFEDGKTTEVIQGDITQVEADALITAINSGQAWFGGIDGVIMRHAGDMFHKQAAARLPLKHLDTVVAKKTGSHSAKFQDVVFVIDDLAGPLRKVIYAALKAASDAGYRHVSVPAIRMGVMAGVVERTPEETKKEMVLGIGQFFKDNPNTSIERITIVIYGQPSL